MVQLDVVNAQADEEVLSPNVAINDLRERVKLLEEQLVDMQIIIGTLESLAKTQFVKDTSVVLGPKEPLSKALGSEKKAKPEKTSKNYNKILGFGETTVNSGFSSSSQSIVRDNLSQASGDVINGNLQEKFENARNSFLQHDYREAQERFTRFIKNNPESILAGSAQYWLGESFYMQGQYKKAAAAFLKGYQTYSSNPKAPNSLFKLAISLDHLGKRLSACKFLKELTIQYPRKPEDFQYLVRKEILRLKC